MKQYKLLAHSRMFELFTIFNRENIPDCRAVAIREIDLSQIEALRVKFQKENKKPSYTALVAKATALTLAEMPDANRAVADFPLHTRVFQFLKINVSVAVERQDGDFGGVFVYTIYDTDQKNTAQITKEIAGLAQATVESGDPRLERWVRMQDGVRLAPFNWILKLVIWFQKNIPSLYIANRGGSVLISSPSKYGVDFIVAHWPYTIGISFGLAKERPWVENDQVVVRKTTTLTLAFDRRILSGANAARFMNRLCEILENPPAALY